MLTCTATCPPHCAAAVGDRRYAAGPQVFDAFNEAISEAEFEKFIHVRMFNRGRLCLERV